MQHLIFLFTEGEISQELLLPTWHYSAWLNHLLDYYFQLAFATDILPAILNLKANDFHLFKLHWFVIGCLDRSAILFISDKTQLLLYYHNLLCFLVKALCICPRSNVSKTTRCSYWRQDSDFAGHWLRNAFDKSSQNLKRQKGLFQKKESRTSVLTCLASTAKISSLALLPSFPTSLPFSVRSMEEQKHLKKWTS